MIKRQTILGVLATGGLMGEVREISAMYLQKTMGKVEAQQPIVVKHEKATDKFHSLTNEHPFL